MLKAWSKRKIEYAAATALSLAADEFKEIRAEIRGEITAEHQLSATLLIGTGALAATILQGRPPVAVMITLSLAAAGIFALLAADIERHTIQIQVEARYLQDELIPLVRELARVSGSDRFAPRLLAWEDFVPRMIAGSLRFRVLVRLTSMQKRVLTILPALGALIVGCALLLTAHGPTKWWDLALVAFDIILIALYVVMVLLESIKRPVRRPSIGS